MKTFAIEKPNTFYYVTSVTFERVAVFHEPRFCEILVTVFEEVRRLFPYKLVAYVIMPDHFHVIVNPIDGDISKWLLRVRGNSAKKILDALKNDSRNLTLKSLTLSSPQKRNHRHALWQKDPSIVDLESNKFLMQKTNYIHLNPIRAGLADHPAKWPWSSYHSYLPHEPGAVPIEVDLRPRWTEEQIREYTSGGSPTLNPE